MIVVFWNFLKFFVCWLEVVEWDPKIVGSADSHVKFGRSKIWRSEPTGLGIL